MTVLRRSGYEVILCATQNITIKPTSAPNTPAVLLHCLLTSAEPVTENTHDCLAKIHIFPSVRSDLSNVLSEQGEHVFVDGSCAKPDNMIFHCGYEVCLLPYISFTHVAYPCVHSLYR